MLIPITDAEGFTQLVEAGMNPNKQPESSSVNEQGEAIAVFSVSQEIANKFSATETI